MLRQAARGRTRVRVAGRKEGRLASEKRKRGGPSSGGLIGQGLRQYDSEEVLRMYAVTPELAEQVLFVDHR